MGTLMRGSKFWPIGRALIQRGHLFEGLGGGGDEFKDLR